MKIKKIIALFLVSSTVCFAGCNFPGSGGNTVDNQTGVLPHNINELGNQIKEINDMPDWTGDKISIAIWDAQGTNAANIGKLASNDVFRKELERVTGITLDASKSIDNNGGSSDARISKIIATNSWPDIAFQLGDSIVERLANEDIIYDLTDVVPQYATNYIGMVNSSEKLRIAYDELKLSDGKHYVWACPWDTALETWDENYSPAKYSEMFRPDDSRSWIWVRDDILKQIYPNAKTVKEIEEIYMEKGKFTQEDMSDVTIKGTEGLRDLLKKINDLNITEDGRKISPFYTHSGGDNWNIMTLMIRLAGSGSSQQPAVNYFSYFDVAQGKLIPTIKQPWFKDITKFAVQLVIDGLASKEALIDNAAAFEQKKNNGQYAVIYQVTPPTADVLRAAGKDYAYRRVMIDVPMDTDRFVSYESITKLLAASKAVIFNKKIKPEQLEQVVRFLDFFYSDAGMNFTEWGPKDAELYIQNPDGTRVFTDENVANYRLRNLGGDAATSETMIANGYLSWPPISHFATAANKYSAKVMYPTDMVRNPGGWIPAWNYGYIEEMPEFPLVKRPWEVYTWSSDVANIKKFWDARQSFEDAMKLIFTSQSDAEFEDYYSKMVSVFETNGLDDKTFEEYNRVFAEENKEYMEGLLNWNKN